MSGSPSPISTRSRFRSASPLHRRRGFVMANNLTRIVGALALLIATHAAFAILPIEHWQTKRGAHVYFVENHDLPILDVSVDFPAGAGFDSREKSGAANMTANMLRLGAGGMDEDEIARKLAD